MIIKAPENLTKIKKSKQEANLRKRQIQFFLYFQRVFSSSILEKPHLEYNDTVRYFVCTFNWLDCFKTIIRQMSHALVTSLLLFLSSHSPVPFLRPFSIY